VGRSWQKSMHPSCCRSGFRPRNRLVRIRYGYSVRAPSPLPLSLEGEGEKQRGTQRAPYPPYLLLRRDPKYSLPVENGWHPTCGTTPRSEIPSPVGEGHGLFLASCSLLLASLSPGERGGGEGPPLGSPVPDPEEPCVQVSSSVSRLSEESRENTLAPSASFNRGRKTLGSKPARSSEASSFCRQRSGLSL